MPRASSHPGLTRLHAWFSARGWSPYPFQEQTWHAYLAGASGLIHIPTGAGKTYAAYGGPLADLLADPAPSGLRVIYITPLRSVSRDIELALKAPIRELNINARVESRTGDTSSSIRTRQRTQPPQVLVTTPESLSLMLTWEDSEKLFKHLRCVIIDEWHELLSTKRGTQTELALARLRAISPILRTWALSATLQNLEEAARAAVGEPRGDGHRPEIPESRSDALRQPGAQAPGTSADSVGALKARLSHRGNSTDSTDNQPPLPRMPAAYSPPPHSPHIISAKLDRPITIRTILPSRPNAFPWAGHLGLSILPETLATLDPERSTLLFTNTRSQAELWHQALQLARPEWSHLIGLHHGSVDHDERERIEAGLKDGSIRLVVATSSLDLGVDFAPVEEVYQIGSPKGIARLLQRAGRSGHRPGAPCRITCVPTHGLELIEIDAVRHAIAEGSIEPRTVANKPLDVLAQHMVTSALGGGFIPDDLYNEVRTTYSFRDLTRQEFDWTLKLVREGGATLWAYPEYRKLADTHGRHTIASVKIAQMHRLNIGTIVSEATMSVAYTSGRRLGSIEKYFINLLKPGVKFLFGGKVVEFVKIRELTAYVKPSSGKTTFTPHWAGTRLPISESLGQSVRRTLERAAAGNLDSPELQAASYIVSSQQRLSHIPKADELLIETCQTREGHHIFVYPFDGRLVHLGLAAILSLRLSRLHKATYTISANDYGLELLTGIDNDPTPLLTRQLFTDHNLLEDSLASINIAELSRAQFREVARVAGLIFTAYPGVRKSAKQIHANAGLLFDVFTEFDPGNLLLEQARREVMERQFERGRLARVIHRLRASTLRIVAVDRPTPLGFPLVIEREGGTLTSQSILERVQAMKLQWDQPPSTSRSPAKASRSPRKPR